MNSRLNLKSKPNLVQQLDSVCANDVASEPDSPTQLLVFGTSFNFASMDQSKRRWLFTPWNGTCGTGTTGRPTTQRPACAKAPKPPSSICSSPGILGTCPIPAPHPHKHKARDAKPPTLKVFFGSFQPHFSRFPGRLSWAPDRAHLKCQTPRISTSS